MKRKKCVAYKSCRKKAKYVDPNAWCSKHWNMWWDYGMKGKKDLPYMKIRRKYIFAIKQFN